jgi:large subunit ribosomal protein L1
LTDNYAAALDEILRLKPSSSKGTYLKKIVVSTSQGPGVAIDPSVTRISAASKAAADA